PHPLSLPDALPISAACSSPPGAGASPVLPAGAQRRSTASGPGSSRSRTSLRCCVHLPGSAERERRPVRRRLRALLVRRERTLGGVRAARQDAQAVVRDGAGG